MNRLWKSIWETLKWFAIVIVVLTIGEILRHRGIGLMQWVFFVASLIVAELVVKKWLKNIVKEAVKEVADQRV